MSVTVSILLAGLPGVFEEGLHLPSTTVLAAALVLACVLVAAYLYATYRAPLEIVPPSTSRRQASNRKASRADGDPAPTASPDVPLQAGNAPARTTRSIESEPPRRRPAGGTPEPIRDPKPNSASDRRTVLVVDDNETVIRFVERALGDTYAVVSAANGREALDSAAETRPDLIISDIMMPVMDGRELCRTVKDDPDLRHVPVVLLTALANQADRIEGLELGSDDYIFKPFDARELRARVRNLIRAREEQRRLSLENRRLETVSERKTDLINLAAHDLKNPLTAIRELADVLKQEVGEQSEAFVPAELIHRSSDQMLQLVSSLLESEAIEEGRIPVHPQRIDVADLATDVVRRNDALAERKGQTIELTMPGEDCEVDVDPLLVMEAMDNLINNAVKYSPDGATIRVAVLRGEDHARFSVSDAGPGIPEDEQHLLFRKFQRLSARPTGGESSSGLGLAIVKQIIDLHDGALEVMSIPGEGSTFSFDLPLPVSEPAFA